MTYSKGDTVQVSDLAGKWWIGRVLKVHMTGALTINVEPDYSGKRRRFARGYSRDFVTGLPVLFVRHEDVTLRGARAVRQGATMTAAAVVILAACVQRRTRTPRKPDAVDYAAQEDRMMRAAAKAREVRRD